MQVIGHSPAGFTHDADTVLPSIAQRREGIVATHLFAVQHQRHTDILAWRCRQDRAVIHRGEIEGGDLGALLYPLDQRERPRTAPAARGLGFLVVNGRFGADQDIRQLPVGRAPGIHHLRRGDLAAQHFRNRPQQAGAHNRVMLRQDLQGHMFIDDLGHQIAQLIQLVDMSRVHQHPIGQGAGLIAAGLVGLVEQRANFGVLGQHHAVEMGDQRFTATFQ